MLSRLVRQRLPSARNVVAARGARPFATIKEMQDTSTCDTTTKTYTHPSTLEDPNAEMRGFDTKLNKPVFMRTMTGYHREDGGMVWYRDALPSIIAVAMIIIGIPFSIGHFFNPGDTGNDWYYQNQILRRQTDVKKQFGKGGGGWGTGTGGVGYDQRKAEHGTLDKHRKKDLVEGQPTKFKGVGDTNAPHIPEHQKVGFKNGPTKTIDLRDGPTKKA